MKIEFEIVLILTVTLFILYFGHISRNLGIKIFQEKLYALILGLLIGLICVGTKTDLRILHIDYCYTLVYCIFLPIVLLERIFNCYKGFLWQEIGSIVVYTIFGSFLCLLFISVLIYALFRATDSELALKEAVIFGTAISISGNGFIGVSKDQ